MCIAAGLVGGEAFSIDASLIKADVDKTKRIPGDQPFAWHDVYKTPRVPCGPIAGPKADCAA
jgi:hypothetical protein